MMQELLPAGLFQEELTERPSLHQSAICASHLHLEAGGSPPANRMIVMVNKCYATLTSEAAESVPVMKMPSSD